MIYKENKNFIFLNQLNDLIKKNILNCKNINIVIDIDNDNKVLSTNEKSLIKFIKLKGIPFLIKNNFQNAVRCKAQGVYITSDNKKVIKPILLKKKFLIVGSVHNQREYKQKLNQNCSIMMLSPLFYNDKYSRNKILNVNKFNLIAKDWCTSIFALGGIRLDNIRKINLTKANGIGFKSLFLTSKLKNLPTNFCRQVLRIN
jgi:thiamine monophosphate synthase